MAQGPSPVPLELKDYQLTGVEIVRVDAVPSVIGHGSYGVVLELRYHGLKCAGKQFYEILYHETTRLEKEAILRMIIKECNTLAKMRHPHIVQFLGVYCTAESPLPLLVMEFLPTNLTRCLEKYDILPDEISYTILEDIACALSYLHSKSFAHRDLSTNNILLTSDMRAKISDLGGAKDLTSKPRRELMSKQPGTIDFMPPEALEENAQYGLEIDIFSFGVVLLAVICGEHPTPRDRYQKNDAAQGTESFQQLTETARRKEYIDRIVSGHPMLTLICDCLDEPDKRPNANEVQEKISDEKLKLAVSDKDKISLLKEKKDKDKKIGELESNRLAIQAENADLKERVGQLEDQVRRSQINTDTDELKTKEIENLREQIRKHKEKEETCIRDMTRNHSKIHNLAEQRNKALRVLASNDKLHLLHDQVKLKFNPLKESQTASNSVRPVELHAPMTATQCTLIGSTLYFGGGETQSTQNEERDHLFALNSPNNTLERQPKCPVIHFGLGNLGGKLALVGGRSPDDKMLLSSKVYVLEGMNESAWSSKLPCLSVPRARACVISQTEDESSVCIAACGGRVFDELNKEVSTSIVEVYHSGSPHWVRVTDLPAPRAALRATVLHNTAYLMGGYQNMGNPGKAECYSIPLCNLFHKDRRIAWTTMKELPTESATPAHICGTLLAVGGSVGEGKPVHAYNPNKRQWVHIADLTEGLSHATAAALPDGRVVIIGGRVNADTRNRNKKIFIATLTGQIL